MIFVTGGAGFIGANFIGEWFTQSSEPVLNIDCLTYAGNRLRAQSFSANPAYRFSRATVEDRAALDALFAVERPRAVIHFAAETHVDRSIDDPGAFVRTNVLGTATLLSAAHAYWSTLTLSERADFRFLHISTDEVYGSLMPDDPPFTETSVYAPNSPYAASKAGADHLVRAYFHTYGLPVLTTNCSNNYGPYQYPEKLLPLMLTRALAGKALPLYGDGEQIRDWLYVSDHCAALRRVLARGAVGETYNIGGGNELRNIDVVNALCDLLDRIRPKVRTTGASDGAAASYREQITFVADRPGHDRRYAIDAGKIARELNWRPMEPFASGLEKTVRWYLQHADGEKPLSPPEDRSLLARQALTPGHRAEGR